MGIKDETDAGIADAEGTNLTLDGEQDEQDEQDEDGHEHPRPKTENRKR